MEQIAVLQECRPDMRQFGRRHTFLLMLIAVAYLAPSGVYAAKRQADVTTVGFISHSRLMVLTLPSGAVRRPTTAEQQRWQIEVAKWKTQGTQHFFSDTLDGKLAVANVDEGPGPVSSPFVVLNPNVELGGGVMSPTKIDRLVNGSTGWGFRNYQFAGWLPDSHHFVIVGHDANSSHEGYVRCIVDVVHQKVSRFNGWISQDGRMAIVPSKEGRLAEDHSNRDAAHGFIDFKSNISYYAVALPSNIDNYRLSAVSKRKLTIAGKPFQLQPDDINVAFSRNGRWAICGDPNGFRTVQFLISLQSGVVRKLNGKHPLFINSQ